MGACRTCITWALLGMAFLSAQVQPTATRAIQVQGAPMAEERRIALVIGNGTYRIAPLAHAVNDARDMAEALRRCGFAVTRLENANRDQMATALREFGDQLLRGGVGLFYYAGHGMQAQGRNYLIPVNADIQREDEVPYQALDAEVVLAKMETARNRLNIVILDACRNNPFGRGSRSGVQGLAQMDAPKGTFIAFSTAPGRVASDGAGRNGLYTRHLLANLATPGLKLEDLFKRVRTGVLRDSAEQQMPWDSSSLMGDFFFRPAEGLPAPGPAEAATLELAFWNSIKDSPRAADFEAYLKRFPSGTFVELARNRLDAMRAPVPEPGPAPGESHTFLGVMVQDLTPDLQASLGVARGALVADVADGSPADEAGIQPLDVITALDGRVTDSPAALVEAVRAQAPGARIRASLVRDGKPLVVVTELASGVSVPSEEPPPLPDTGTIAPTQEDFFRKFFGDKPVYGFFATELTPELRQRYGLGSAMQGVMVSSVDPQGPAKDLLSAGDVVIALLLPEGKRTFRTLPEYLQALGRLSQKPMSLLAHRTRYRQNVVITIPCTPPPK